MRDVLSISVDDLIYVETVRNLFGVELSTPNMDRLAEMGVSFSNAFCTTALCNPSRMAILTGQSPFTTRVHGNEDDLDPVALASTFPALFREAGYASLGFGKLAHRLEPDESEAMFDAWSDVRTTESRDIPNVEAAIEAIAARGSDPLLLMVGLHDPHAPFESPQVFRDLYPLDRLEVPPITEYEGMPEFIRSRLDASPDMTHEELTLFVRDYLANISEMDHSLGLLLDAVEADANYNPVIALWSDHGWSLGDHSNYKKFDLWDETGRAPLIIVDPEAPDASRGTTYDHVVSLLDIAPTLFDLAGLPIPATVQGTSLAPLLRSEPLNHTNVALTNVRIGLDPNR